MSKSFDNLVRFLVADYQTKTERNRAGWRAYRSREAARGWLSRLFFAGRNPIPPPLPPPLPPDVVARAIELGLIPGIE